jgi:3-oxoacyl-[acyl-carrier-protein] synthase III
LKNFIEIAFGSKKINIENTCIKKFGKEKTKLIINKTGPKNLNICNNKEDTISLAIKAYKKLINKNKKINFKNLIFVTENNVRNYPGNSFLFASHFNLNEEINLYDINSGCTGFVDAVKLADKLNGNTLIICSETYSKNINHFQRNISTLFADAAAVFFFDKKKFKVIDKKNGFKKNTFDFLTSTNNVLKMDGKHVFDFVRTVVKPKLTNYIKSRKSKLVKNIFLHQASKVVISYFKTMLSNKYLIPSNLEKRGNTVSATIPILIYDNIKLFKKNVILCGFGVGLSYSIVTLEINE